jgi:hypothetical protein
VSTVLGNQMPATWHLGYIIATRSIFRVRGSLLLWFQHWLIKSRGGEEEAISGEGGPCTTIAKSIPPMHHEAVPSCKATELGDPLHPLARNDVGRAS